MINSNILVTGASGFIGRRLVAKLLTLGYNVYGISKSNSINGVKNYNVDLTDKERLKEVIQEIKPKIIFHLASTLDRNQANREQIININYNGTVNLLESLDSIDYSCFVNTSTAEVYSGNKPPFKEDMKASFSSPYSESKLMAEDYCNKLIKNGKPIITLRPFIVYGPGQTGKMFISQIMDSCRNNKDFDMTKGEQTRDFVYVDDVADAFISAANSVNALGETINVCSGAGVKLVDIAKIVNDLWNNPIKINIGAVPYRDNEIWNYYGDISKAKNLLKWVPRTSLFEGLNKTVDWYKSN